MRGRALSFTFDGKPVHALEATDGSALHAAGRRTFSRTSSTTVRAGSCAARPVPNCLVAFAGAACGLHGAARDGMRSAPHACRRSTSSVCVTTSPAGRSHRRLHYKHSLRRDGCGLSTRRCSARAPGSAGSRLPSRASGGRVPPRHADVLVVGGAGRPGRRHRGGRLGADVVLADEAPSRGHLLAAEGANAALRWPQRAGGRRRVLSTAPAVGFFDASCRSGAGTRAPGRARRHVSPPGSISRSCSPHDLPGDASRAPAPGRALRRAPGGPRRVAITSDRAWRRLSRCTARGAHRAVADLRAGRRPDGAPRPWPPRILVRHGTPSSRRADAT